jgi:hypothetical protein
MIPPEIDYKTLQALDRVLNYLECTERNDHDAPPKEEREQLYHIYLSVQIVRNWFNGVAPITRRRFTQVSAGF